MQRSLRSRGNKHAAALSNTSHHAHNEGFAVRTLWAGSRHPAATLDPFAANPLADPIKRTETLTGLLPELHYTWFAEHIGMLITDGWTWPSR
jgi:hypothetical protein